MTRQIRPPDEVEVVVSGVFTTHHCFRTEAGIMGELTMSALRATDVFRAADESRLTVHRTSWWRSRYELQEKETVLAKAQPRGFWRREIVIRFDTQKYVLRRAGFWSRSWHLDGAGGIRLLEVRPRGVFRRGAHVKVMVPVDVELLVFAYHLVYTRWQEEAAAASSAASTAAVTAAAS